MYSSPFAHTFIMLVVTLAFTGCQPREPSENIIEAVSRKHYKFEEVQAFLENDSAAVNESDNDGQKPLHIATGYGRTRAVVLLLEHGANVNATDNNGRTALHYACDTGETKAAKLLLDAHAEVKVADNDGDTPLHTVVEFNCGSIELVRLLIASGAEVNAKTDEGETPLDIAVRLKEYYQKPSKDREKSFDQRMIKELETVEEVLKQAMAEKST